MPFFILSIPLTTVVDIEDILLEMTWIWFVEPCSIFLLERMYRMTKTFSEKGKTQTKLGLILASKVVHLVIKRPRNFKFKAGDYIFINIPAITKYQWHPFTISSAPEQNDIR